LKKKLRDVQGVVNCKNAPVKRFRK
jgi:hypothetical protein